MTFLRRMISGAAPVSTDEKAVNELLTRGVEEVFVRDHLKARLMAGKPLRVKFGIDPTAPTLHIGRAVVLRKLRAFQDLGHTVVLIVGDFTAQIGDPSDKLEKRPMLTREQIEKNMKGYKALLGKIIDLRRAEVVYNSAWLAGLKFAEIAELAESFSVQQMSGRRNFKDRLDRGEEVSLREFFYPLMQGYDSVAVKADVELGGFDQLFNLKAGRVIQKHYGHKEQDVLTVQMLEGTDGRKMSTSWGNVITITDKPQDMFGKIMSLRDELISKYFLLCTSVPEAEIASLADRMKSGQLNPKEVKMRLAEEIVTIYHDTAAATAARAEFEEMFSKGGLPDEVPEVMVKEGATLMDAALAAGVVKSKGEFRRLVEEGAVSRLSDTDEGAESTIKDVAHVTVNGHIYKIGKRRFVKVRIQ